MADEAEESDPSELLELRAAEGAASENVQQMARALWAPAGGAAGPEDLEAMRRRLGEAEAERDDVRARIAERLEALGPAGEDAAAAHTDPA